MSVIARETLIYFLSDYAAPGEDFPTGARLQAAGNAHRTADTFDCGWDYSYDEIVSALSFWVTFRDAHAYLTGYSQKPLTPTDWRYRLSRMHSRA